MKSYKFKKDYHYLIYGAAFMGMRMLKGLKEAGYFVDAFLDKRADYLKCVEGLSVYHPEKFSPDSFQNTVVIIAITNPFEHTMVADYLFKLGYEKILFNPCHSLERANPSLKKMGNLYIKIQDGQLKETDDVCTYTQDLLDFQFSNGVILKEFQDYVVTLLPVDLCFYGNSHIENENASPDVVERRGKPIYMSSYELINFFRAVAGVLPDSTKAVNAFSDYVMRNESVYSKMFPRTKQGMADMLTNRSNLFYGMLRELQNGNEFFINAPVEAVWNEEGYFNINDGQHRVCFFLTMGFSHVPAKMSRADYEKWINREKAIECISFAKKNHIVAAYAPIPHPNFYFFPSHRDVGGHTRIQKISQFLMNNHIPIRGKSVLDAGSYFCYLSQFFARLGANVTAVEFDPTSSKFGQLLNELLYCSSVKSMCLGLDNLDTSQTFSFTIMLTVLYWYLDKPMGMQILKNIDSVTEDFLIWESGDRPTEEIEFILKNSSFKKYIKISETTGTGKIRELGIFYREHIELKPLR